MFHKFCKRFTELKYKTYIYRPEGEELARVLNTYALLGLPGCVGSTDCTHIKWDRCPVSLFNLCKGKESYPSKKGFRSYSGFWGIKNDKTIVRQVCCRLFDIILFTSLTTAVLFIYIQT